MGKMLCDAFINRRRYNIGWPVIVSYSYHIVGKYRIIGLLSFSLVSSISSFRAPSPFNASKSHLFALFVGMAL